MAVEWTNKEIGFVIELSPRDVVKAIVTMYDDDELIEIVNELVCELDPAKYEAFRISLEDSD